MRSTLSPSTDPRIAVPSRDLLREPIRGVQELQQLVGVPVLASLPHVGIVERSVIASPMPYEFEPMLAAESRKNRALAWGLVMAAVVALAVLAWFLTAR